MEEMLRSFVSTCSSIGLTISTAKAKVLAVLPSGEGDLLVVDTFAYLGYLMEKNAALIQK